MAAIINPAPLFATRERKRNSPALGDWSAGLMWAKERKQEKSTVPVPAPGAPEIGASGNPGQAGL